MGYVKLLFFSFLHFFFSHLLLFPPAVCFNLLLLVGLVLSHLVSFATYLCLF